MLVHRCGQNGSHNESTVAETGDGASAVIDQDGVGLTSTVSQSAFNAYARTRQKGFDNESSVTQADTARSNVEQGLGDASSSNNFAEVNQNVGSAGSISDINQDGDLNETRITQSGADSDSFAYTRGNNNRLTVNQSGAKSVSVAIQYDDATNNKATVGTGQTGARHLQLPRAARDRQRSQCPVEGHR